MSLLKSGSASLFIIVAMRKEANYCVVNALNNSSTWYTDYSYGLCGCDYLLLCLAHVWVWVFTV